MAKSKRKVKSNWRDLCLIYQIQVGVANTISLCGCSTLDDIYNLLIAVQAQTQMFIPKHLYKCMCLREQQTN